MPTRFRLLIVLVLLASAVQSLAASDDLRNTFVKRWEDKRVVLKQTLFTLVYDQKSRIGKTSRKRDGLTVVGLSGASLQFTGRFSEEDIVDQDPDRLVEAIRNTYINAYTFDIGSYHRVDPIVVERFESGTVFIVRDVRLDDDSVRLSFSAVPDDRKGEFATELTVQWTVPLSRTFSEAPLVENLIRQYVDLLDDRSRP